MTKLSRWFHPHIAALSTVLFTAHTAHSELVVNSSNGYQVHIYIQLTDVVPSTLSCPWGYNWNVALNYNVWFTGANIPSGLYTLQGRVVCGSQQLFFDLPNSGGDGSLVTGENPWRNATDCATIDLGTLGCNNAIIEINGPGISPQNISYAPDVLPIELIGFSATAVGDHVRLDWATATETNNASFTIERSSEGSGFEPVLSVPGAVNSQQTLFYQGLDRTAPHGLSYYRLKQTDLDGHFSYSSIVSVALADPTGPVVAPNPCTGDAFQITGDVVGNRLEIRDMNGALLRSMRLSSSTIAHGGLPQGVYTLHLTDPIKGSTSTLKLVRE